MRFDLADLSLFRHVADAGSITRGAERAHLALAAASTRIRRMEDALGVKLLTRGRQGEYAARCCSMRAAYSTRPSACTKTSALTAAGSPAKYGCCPTLTP
jgi:hypothetical protein